MRGHRGGQPGDLYIFINVLEHPDFRRDRKDLLHVAKLPMTRAALGCDIEVPTIDGGAAKVRIPAGSQSGKRLRLNRKGMPVLRSRSQERGDMYVDLQVRNAD